VYEWFAVNVVGARTIKIDAIDTLNDLEATAVGSLFAAVVLVLVACTARRLNRTDNSSTEVLQVPACRIRRADGFPSRAMGGVALRDGGNGVPR